MNASRVILPSLNDFYFVSILVMDVFLLCVDNHGNFYFGRMIFTSNCCWDIESWNLSLNGRGILY